MKYIGTKSVTTDKTPAEIFSEILRPIKELKIDEIRSSLQLFF